MIKKIIIGGVLLVATIIGVKAIAHARLSKEEKVARITEKMSKKLELTTAQKEKVYQINLERANGHEAAYHKGRDKAVIEAAVANWQEQLKTVLTAEQAKKLGL